MAVTNHYYFDFLLPAIPTFMEDGKPQNKNATEGDDVTFTCKIQGIPAPKVEWMKNGDPITDSESFVRCFVFVLDSMV